MRPAWLSDPASLPSLTQRVSLALRTTAVYWRYLSYRTYYQHYGGNSDRAFQGEMPTSSIDRLMSLQVQ